MSETEVAEIELEEPVLQDNSFQIPESRQELSGADLVSQERRDEEVRRILESLQEEKKPEPELTSDQEKLDTLVPACEQELKDLLGFPDLDVISSWQKSVVIEGADGHTYFEDNKGNRAAFEDKTGTQFGVQEVSIEQDFRGKEFGGSIKIHLRTYHDADGNVIHEFMEQTYRAPSEKYAPETEELEPSGLQDGKVNTLEQSEENVPLVNQTESSQDNAFNIFAGQTTENTQAQTQPTTAELFFYGKPIQEIITTLNNQSSPEKTVIQESTVQSEHASKVEIQESVSVSNEMRVDKKTIVYQETQYTISKNNTSSTAQEQAAQVQEIKTSIEAAQTEVQAQEIVDIKQPEVASIVQNHEIGSHTETLIATEKQESNIVTTSDIATMKAIESRLPLLGTIDVIAPRPDLPSPTEPTLDWGDQPLLHVLLDSDLSSKVETVMTEIKQQPEGTRILIAEVPAPYEESDGVMIFETTPTGLSFTLYVAPQQIIPVESLQRVMPDVPETFSTPEITPTVLNTDELTPTERVDVEPSVSMESKVETVVSELTDDTEAEIVVVAEEHDDLSISNREVSGELEVAESSKQKDESKQVETTIETVELSGSRGTNKKEENTRNSPEVRSTSETTVDPVVRSNVTRPLVIPLFSSSRPSPVGGNQGSDDADNITPSRSSVRANLNTQQAI